MGVKTAVPIDRMLTAKERSAVMTNRKGQKIMEFKEELRKEEDNSMKGRFGER